MAYNALQNRDKGSMTPKRHRLENFFNGVLEYWTIFTLMQKFKNNLNIIKLEHIFIRDYRNEVKY